MMMLFPGAVGIVAEDAVGVGYHVWLRDVCSATVRRPWDSRRSTPDLLTLSQWTKTTQKKSITELEYETWRTPGIQKAVQHGPCSRCYHLLTICRVTC